MAGVWADSWLRNEPLRAIVPQIPIPQASRHKPAKPRPSACPELDCVRHLLPRRIIAATERRARSIGVGAERVLICADAITEEAYLTALAHSLGTSYERFDGIARADCPLNDDQLINAAAAGLLPLAVVVPVAWPAPLAAPAERTSALRICPPGPRRSPLAVTDRGRIR